MAYIVMVYVVMVYGLYSYGMLRPLSKMCASIYILVMAYQL